MISFRRGAVVSLALEGVSLHKIMDHVWWKSNKTALHYMKLTLSPPRGLPLTSEIVWRLSRIY